jgi:DNA-binding winged helix-turn-helix (wHTH) protein
MQAGSTRRLLRFGVFEVDLKSGELRKQGLKMKLAEQPFQVLATLLEHPGEVVTREQLQQKLWSSDTFVDFDNSLNKAINRIREVLGDSADNPRFVETLARRGYRFIALVEPADGRTAGEPLPPPPSITGNYQTLTAETQSLPQRGRPPGHQRLYRWIGLGVCLVLIAVGVTFYLRWHSASLSQSTPRIVPLTTYPGWEKFPALSPDGNQVAFSWSGEKNDNRDIYLRLIGEDSLFRLTDNPAPEFYPAWSPDGRRIAFVRVSESQAEVLVVPSLGGAERRICSLAPQGRNPFGISWSPDGKSLAVGLALATAPILLVSAETGEKTNLYALPEGFRDSRPSFSPNGDSLAFVRTVAGTVGRGDI